MKRQVVFEEEEFNQLFLKFVDNIMEDMKKGWGFKMISNDGGVEATTREQIGGNLLLAWNNTFNPKEGK